MEGSVLLTQGSGVLCACGGGGGGRGRGASQQRSMLEEGGEGLGACGAKG